MLEIIASAGANTSSAALFANARGPFGGVLRKLVDHATIDAAWPYLKSTDWAQLRDHCRDVILELEGRGFTVLARRLDRNYERLLDCLIHIATQPEPGDCQLQYRAQFLAEELAATLESAAKRPETMADRTTSEFLSPRPGRKAVANSNDESRIYHLWRSERAADPSMTYVKFAAKYGADSHEVERLLGRIHKRYARQRRR
jgi:hypothetical protein